jgi:hypothetical protein
MHISIVISVEGNRVVALSKELGVRVTGEHFREVLENLTKSFERKFYSDIQSGALDRKDPDLIQLISGNDGEYGLESDLIQIRHEIYMEKIEKLMGMFYPSLLQERMWRMLVPRHNEQYDPGDEKQEQHSAFVLAETQELEAYDDLEVSGVNGEKWQAFLADYMADPYQNNKQFLIKHGLVMKCKK